MSTMASQLMSPRMHGVRVPVGVGVGVLVGVAVGVLVAVAVAVGVAVGNAISVSRVARLLVSVGSTVTATFWSTVTTLVMVTPLGVPAWACTVSVNVAVVPDARVAPKGRKHSTRPTWPTDG